MATLKGKIWSQYSTLSSRTTRDIIFYRRVVGGEITPFGIGLEPDVNVQPQIETWRYSQQKPNVLETAPNVGVHSRFIPPGRNIINDYVAIIDIDYNGTDKGIEVIKLPFIPTEVEVNIESSFVSIKPIGRNNAKYHYTGSEDTIEFEIDWHSFEWKRDDVIKNCRKIESLSKADSYNGSPHRVMLKWGEENVLFDNQYFVVLSASYRMVQFNKGQMGPDGVLMRTHMLPVQAYQKVVLGRITSKNLTKKEIEYVKDYSTASII